MSIEGRQFKQKRGIEHNFFERANAKGVQSGLVNDSTEGSSSDVKKPHISDTLEVVLSIKGIELNQMKNTSDSDVDSDSDEVFEEASQEQPTERQRKRQRQYSVTFHHDVRKTENEPVSRQNSSAPLIRKQKNSESEMPYQSEHENESVWCKKNNIWYMLIFLCISASVLSVCFTIYFVFGTVKDTDNVHVTKLKNRAVVNSTNYTQAESQDYSPKSMALVLLGGERSERIVASVEIFPSSLFPSCTLPLLPEKLKWGNAGFVNDDLLVCGGVRPDSKLSRACWALDSTSRHWRPLDNLTR